MLAAGHRADDDQSSADWEALARLGQPIILYMPMTQLAGITAALMKGGMAADTPAALLQRRRPSTSASSRARSAAWSRTRRRNGIGSPAIVVIGAVAGLRREQVLAGAGRLAMTRAADRLGGVASGAGKTTIALGLMRAFARRGLARAALQVRAGLYRSRLPRRRRRPAELQSRQLGDVAGLLSDLVARHPADLVVTEGVMGLFDGAGGRGGHRPMSRRRWAGRSCWCST